jgi:ABC-2 type transport system permease protein
MKGLVIKDLLSLKSTLIFQIILFFFMGFGLLETTSPESVYIYTAAAVAISSAFTISSMNSDEKSSWTKYALTTGVSRDQIILSKYVLSLLLMVGGFVISMIVNTVFIKRNNLDWSLNYGTAAIMSLAAGIVLISLIIPAAIKFKAENARYIMLIFLFALVGLGFVSSQVDFSPVESLTGGAGLVLLGILAVFFLLSFTVSKSLFQKKEF